MKKLLLLPFLAILLLSFVLYWFYLNTKAISSKEEFKDFLIVKGTSASQIGNKLYKEGLIRSPLAFKIYIQILGKAGKIQAGEYRLSTSFSLFQILNQLGRGPVEIWVTIPEGLRREEIARKFASSLSKDDEFVKAFLENSSGLEGYLFPDTYLFPKTASASGIVNKMTATFDNKISTLTNQTSLSEKQLLILASLIERETKTDEERPVVAGILMNRLGIGMALQVDATVQYAKGDWEPVAKEDLLISSPYNTYKFAGLPPTPIASPGLSSLSAAYAPEDSNYFYYIHDSKGNIYYAKTLEEHNQNIRKFLGK